MAQSELDDLRQSVYDLAAVVSVLVSCRGQVHHLDLELRRRLNALTARIYRPPAETPTPVKGAA